MPRKSQSGLPTGPKGIPLGGVPANPLNMPVVPPRLPSGQSDRGLINAAKKPLKLPKGLGGTGPSYL
jgi:hypothetical protein